MKALSLARISPANALSDVSSLGMSALMRIASLAISAFLTVEAIFFVVVLVAFVGVRAFGFECYDVLTNSMSPTMPAGTLVWVDTNISPESVVRGDIVAYRTDAGTSVLHRVVENNRSDETITFKGDGNDVEDAPVSYSQVIGKSKFSILGVGAIANLFMTYKVQIFIAAAVVNAVLLVVLELIRRQTYKVGSSINKSRSKN